MNDADLIEAAVDVIDTYGHVQGHYEMGVLNSDPEVSDVESRKGFCLVGAATYAMGSKTMQGFLETDIVAVGRRMATAFGFEPYRRDEVFELNDNNGWDYVRDFALSRAKDLRNRGEEK